ncbi:unknown [Firmicutes bacterium CAG:65]|nr:unknown [Firmicutes bacterium CAG:65]
MGCRMVDDVRTISAEDILDAFRIADRGDQHYQIQCRILTDQLLLDRIGIVLIDIDDDQLFRLMTGDLPAQLAADGPAATGD